MLGVNEYTVTHTHTHMHVQTGYWQVTNIQNAGLGFYLLTSLFSPKNLHVQIHWN